MATPYSITINLDTDTLQSLNQNGLQLFGFKAVQGPPQGMPVVWFQTAQFLSSTQVNWTEDYQAYISTTTQLNPQTTITAASSCSIDVGEVATVQNGVLTPTQGPDNQGIRILNATTTQYTCGLAQQTGGTGPYKPICAFPLLPNLEDLLVPIEKVFLMFATPEVDTGMVLEESFSPGALIDLTGQTSVTVTYSSKQSGGWVPQPGLTVFPPNTSLLPMLTPLTPLG